MTNAARHTSAAVAQGPLRSRRPNSTIHFRTPKDPTNSGLRRLSHSTRHVMRVLEPSHNRRQAAGAGLAAPEKREGAPKGTILFAKSWFVRRSSGARRARTARVEYAGGGMRPDLSRTSALDVMLLEQE